MSLNSVVIVFELIPEMYNIPRFLDGHDKNGFNLGCYRNIQEVFGRKVILWPFPINTRYVKILYLIFKYTIHKITRVEYDQTIIIITHIEIKKHTCY